MLRCAGRSTGCPASNLQAAPPTPACTGQYEGEAQNLVWRQDPSFGEVLDCDEVSRQDRAAEYVWA